MFSTGDTGEDIGRIWNAVLAAAKLGVQERVIFCIIMQESNGDVGVRSPINGIALGGLIQALNGPSFAGRHGLSQAEIQSMVTAGTKLYKQDLEQVGNQNTEDNIYRALPICDSGSVNNNNLSDGGTGTDSYVSDIANRLQGRTE